MHNIKSFLFNQKFHFELIIVTLLFIPSPEKVDVTKGVFGVGVIVEPLRNWCQNVLDTLLVVVVHGEKPADIQVRVRYQKHFKLIVLDLNSGKGVLN